MQSSIPTPTWVSQRDARDYTGISERTLTRLRNGSTDKEVHTPPVLIPGVHWRRISPAPNARVQYNRELLDKAISELSARSIPSLEVSE